MSPSNKESNGSVTLEKLAKLAKVSVSTVSRALNDHPSISPVDEEAAVGAGAQTRLRIPPPHAGEPDRRGRRNHRGDATRARPAAAAVASVLPRAAREHRRSRARSRLRFHRQPSRAGELRGPGACDDHGTRERRDLSRPGHAARRVQPAGGEPTAASSSGARRSRARSTAPSARTTCSAAGAPRSTCSSSAANASCFWAAAIPRRRSAIAATAEALQEAGMRHRRRVDRPRRVRSRVGRSPRSTRCWRARSRSTESWPRAI